MIRTGMHTLTMAMLRDAQTPDALCQAANPVHAIREYGPRGVHHFEMSLDINFLLDGEVENARMLAETRQALDECHATCSVHLPFRGMDISYPSRDVAEGYARMLAAVVRLARPLAPMAYVVHPSGDFMKRLRGFAPNSPFFGKAWDMALFALETLASLGGIGQEELAVENLSHPLAMNDYLLSRSGVSFCLDAGHIAADHSRDGYTIVQAVARYAKRMRAVHLHDVRRENGKTLDHLPLGTGEVDYAAFAQALAASGYEGYVVLEIGSGLEDACASALLFQQALALVGNEEGANRTADG